MSDSEKVEFVESSGNIFADLGPPKPEECLAKAELAIEIVVTESAAPEESGEITVAIRPNAKRLFGTARG